MRLVCAKCLDGDPVGYFPKLTKSGLLMKLKMSKKLEVNRQSSKKREKFGCQQDATKNTLKTQIRFLSLGGYETDQENKITKDSDIMSPFGSHPSHLVDDDAESQFEGSGSSHPILCFVENEARLPRLMQQEI